MFTVFSDTDAAKDGSKCVRVHTPPQPEFDEGNQVCTIDEVPKLLGDKWVLEWTVRDKTPEELADWLLQKRIGMNVTPLQAKIALLNADLLSDVEAVIDDPSTDTLIKLAWTNATEYRRLSPMVNGIASVLGLTEHQLDALFVAAATIQV